MYFMIAFELIFRDFNNNPFVTRGLIKHEEEVIDGRLNSLF